jgi:hypothetical protein
MITLPLSTLSNDRCHDDKSRAEVRNVLMHEHGWTLDLKRIMPREAR